jgi:hypothetical protein
MQFDASRIPEVAARCRAVLALPEFAAVPDLLAGAGVAVTQLQNLVAETARTALPEQVWNTMAGACAKHGIPESGYVLQRFVLLTAGLPNLPRIALLPVPEEVKCRLLEQFLYVCAPDREISVLLDPRHYGFRTLCKFMRLERFPAGQSDWEISGFPRAWISRMPLRDVPRALRCVFLRSGGRRPFFETHTAFRRDLPILTPEDERKTFQLLSRSMLLQPAIRGYLGASWFLDPHLPVVSPHLAWMSDWLRECQTFGAVWTTIGEAKKNAGFLVGDRRRRKLYESGKWKPLTGVLLWARTDLLKWFDWDSRQRQGDSD